MNNKELILIINEGNMSKKLTVIVFILLLVFSCSKEKVADQTVEELALETNFLGKYVFSSINIEESENIDISKYKDLDESIFINFILIIT
jgi:hypothetical protein